VQGTGCLTNCRETCDYTVRAWSLNGVWSNSRREMGDNLVMLNRKLYITTQEFWATAVGSNSPRRVPRAVEIFAVLPIVDPVVFELDGWKYSVELDVFQKSVGPKNPRW
jgi:hypothetical protein